MRNGCLRTQWDEVTTASIFAFLPISVGTAVTNKACFSIFPQVAYLYTKVRSEFGKHCSFKDVPAFLLETVPCSTEYDDNYVARNPSVAELDTSPHMSGKSEEWRRPKHACKL